MFSGRKYFSYWLNCNEVLYRCLVCDQRITDFEVSVHDEMSPQLLDGIA